MINGGKENRIVVRSNERTSDEITQREKVMTVYQEEKPNNKNTTGFYAIFMHTHTLRPIRREKKDQKYERNKTE